jgi:ABC-type branched-subunit amino acid transport system ATPase component
VLLELHAVARSFGGIRAVDGVSGGLEEGRILGLIGPNGSGKTTLLAMIGAAIAPSSGEVRIDSRSMRGWSTRDAALAGIARAFQVPQHAAGLTVLENVMLGAMFGSRWLPQRQAEAEARRTLDEVGLLWLADKRPHEASLGERRGVELARLLAMKPRLALLDEVMGGLSAQNIELTERIILRLRDEGVTLVVVEHLAGVVSRIADEVCVLHQGRVLRWGTPGEVLSDRAVIGAYLGRAGADDA